MQNEKITSKNNLSVKLAVLLRTSARERRGRGLFFLEGWRLCADALASGYEPELLFVTAAAQEKYPIAHKNMAVISEAVAQKLADTQSPQGVFGIFRIKQQTVGFHREASASPQVVVLEHIQDPANLGAIARTAEALGLDGLVASGGCDIYHPKALRASMGALLRLPVAQVDDLPAFLRGVPLPCYAAVPDHAAVPLTACDFSGGALVVIGNEGGGLTEETIAACTQRVTIPMPGRAESLNAAAAAAILMWEMNK